MTSLELGKGDKEVRDSRGQEPRAQGRVDGETKLLGSFPSSRKRSGV